MIFKEFEIVYIELCNLRTQAKYLFQNMVCSLEILKEIKGCEKVIEH